MSARSSDLGADRVLEALAAGAFSAATSLPLDVLVTVNFSAMGVHDPEEARRELHRFVKAMGACFYSAPLAWNPTAVDTWAECQTDEQRLEVFSGLLLVANWDAAFDRGLVSFDDQGRALFKPELSTAARELLAPDRGSPVPLEDSHRRSLERHRRHFGFEA